MSHNESVSIDKVLSSPTFAHKMVLQGLLKFLFDSASNGISLKETDIAVGYFKRGKDFIPGDDTIVRVNIYKLRALLERYYKEEGQQDSLIIEIPRGGYSVQFKERGGQMTRLKLMAFPRKVWFLGVLTAVLLLLIPVLLYWKGLDKETNPIWSSFIDQKKPVSIVLGGPFFFSAVDTATNDQLIMRDLHINSKQDLVKAGKNMKGRLLTELTYPYFSTNNVLPLTDIIPVFAKGDTEVRLQSLSKTNIEEIKTNNIVFIANINSFGYMSRFLAKTSIRLSDNPRTIKIHHGKKEWILNVPDYVNGSYLDYAVLVKLPGSHNNHIMMLGDFHSSGIKGLSHYITDPSMVSKFKDEIRARYGDFPEYFEMVVKVTSYNYVDFDTKLIYFKPLRKEGN